jgi:DNA-directed RNA polymerase alpha subunit/DNA-directed RNA polymerase subunit L
MISDMTINVKGVEYSKLFPDKITNVKLTLEDVPISLTNAIRRIILSEIPNVGFYEKDVKIVEHTSAMHNEFYAHRISLLPIYRDTRLKIVSRINKTTGFRENVFDNDSIVPIFVLNEHNTDDFRHNSHFRDIFSNQFRVFQKSLKVLDKEEDEDGKVAEEVEHTQELDIADFFKPDYFTGEFIHIGVLKTNPNDKMKGQKIHVEAHPSVGTAEKHASYSPITCIPFKYEEDTEEMKTMIFEKTINQQNIERTSKGLALLTENEIMQVRRSFDRLDAARVFKQNRDGECNAITITIESIGVYSPLHAFMDSLYVLELKLIDLMNGIIITSDTIKLNSQYKFRFENNHAILEIIEQNHTLGNLVTDYMKRLTLEHLTNFEENKNKTLYKTTDTLLEVASYRIEHPLQNILRFKLKMQKTKIDQYSSSYKDNTWDEPTRRKAPYLMIFYKTIQLIVHQLNELKTTFIVGQSRKMEGPTAILNAVDKVETSTFRVMDDSYMEKIFYEN